jgi:hypothetical protein
VNKISSSATIQVVNPNNESVISTLVFGQQGDYFVGQGTNITFSEKEIRVSLAKPQARTLNKFVGSRTALISSHRGQIKSLVAQSSGMKTITCTGRFSTSSERPAALKRAQNSCSYAKSLNPNFKFVSNTQQTRLKSQNRTVLVSCRLWLETVTKP